MSKKYFVWKNAACNGKNIEWCEITGKEFFKLVKNPQNAGRRFTRLENDICNDADVIIMECTESQYRDWCRETRKHRYLAPYMKEHDFVSLDYKYGMNELVLHEIIADDSVDVEASVAETEMAGLLYHAIAKLSDDEISLLRIVFQSTDSEREIARKMRIPQKTINNRKLAVIKKIKKIWLKIDFSG